MGEKYVQEEFLSEESLGEKYMGEKYVQEGFLGEESLGESLWVKSMCKKSFWVKSLWVKSIWAKSMCTKGFWVKSLWVKNVGENRGRWDAGFRSPLLRYYNIIYIIIAVAYLQTNPCFNYKICGSCISGHQRVRSFAGYEAIFVLSIWSHLVSWPNLGCCLRSEKVVLPCFAKPRLVC